MDVYPVATVFNKNIENKLNQISTEHLLTITRLIVPFDESVR